MIVFGKLAAVSRKVFGRRFRKEGWKRGLIFPAQSCLQWTFLRVVGFAEMLGRLGPNQWSATLFVLFCFDRIEPLAKPSFLRPLPILIKIRIAI